MTDCARYRRTLLANPREVDPQLRPHLEECPDCTRYTAQLLRFEGKMERALKVNTPPARPAAAPFAAAGAARAGANRRSAWRDRFPLISRARLAMAATVLIVLSAVTGLWIAAPGRSLAADVVAHMAGEPQAWTRTDVPVDPAALDHVLRNSGMSLKPSAGTVSYAQSCGFRGHKVPHLVVQTDMGPVTVMVLVHESVARPVRFDEEGYRGVILPVPGHGSLAVLARGQSMDMDAVRRVAASVQNAIEWAG